MSTIFNHIADNNMSALNAAFSRRLGDFMLKTVIGEPAIKERLAATASINIIAANANHETQHGKLLNQFAYAMNLAVADDVLALFGSKELPAEALATAHEEQELNDLFNKGKESLSKVFTDEVRFSKQTKQEHYVPASEVTEVKKEKLVSSNAIALPSVLPSVPKKEDKNVEAILKKGEAAKVISKPATPVVKDTRPSCDKCHKIMKATKLSKYIINTPDFDSLPDSLKELSGKSLCKECLAKARAEYGAFVKAKSAENSKLAEARDKVAAIDLQLADAAQSLQKAAEEQNKLSPDFQSVLEPKMNEIRTSIQSLTTQRLQYSVLLDKVSK